MTLSFAGNGSQRKALLVRTKRKDGFCSTEYNEARRSQTATLLCRNGSRGKMCKWPNAGNHGPAYHYQTDVLELLTRTQWDLMIAHPPCTHLAVSGARWFKGKQKEQAEALEFVQKLMDATVPRIAIENPISIISSRIRKPDQIIQPFEYGHPYRKTTCLWLKNLPRLTPTDIVERREQKCWKEPPHPDRWKRRSRTYEGIARAMADQWGGLMGELPHPE